MRPVISLIAGTAHAFPDHGLSNMGIVMIKNLILGASIILAFTACTDKDSGGGNAPMVTSETITNTSRCGGRTPVNTNLYSNKWISQMRVSNGVVLSQVLDFNHGRVVAALYAEYQDQKAKLKVYSDIQDQGRSVTFSESETAQTDIMVDGRPFNLSFNFTANTARYKFAGSCLLLQRGSEVTTFVPYRR